MKTRRFVLEATEPLAQQAFVQVELDGEIVKDCISARPGDPGSIWRVVSGTLRVTIGSAAKPSWAVKQESGNVRLLVAGTPVWSHREFTQEAMRILGTEGVE